MNANTNKVTLVPRGAKGQFVAKNKDAANSSTAAAPTTKTPLQLFQESGLHHRMRKQYGATFYADPVAQTGDAVCNLSDDYLMKIYEDIRAAHPGANDEKMWTENGDGNGVGLLVAAMAQAEADPQQQERETSAVNITSSDIRASAHEAAVVLSQDAEYAAIQDKLVEAERVRRRGPVELAWTLERLYVRKDDKGNVLCNLIEGTGPEFDADKKYPWPIIGSKEKSDDGRINNNPDIQKKYLNGAKKAQDVSFYGEMIRDTPAVRQMVAVREQYLLATGKPPTGDFSDMKSPNYCDGTKARGKAQEIKDDIDTMIKNLKKATSVLRQMWAVNEMAAPNSPPRLVASFRVAERWDVELRDWVKDATQLAKMDEPIKIQDIRTGEYETFKVGEFLAHDPVAAGLKGGTLGDFRASVKTKRTGNSGTGQTPDTAQKAKANALGVADLDRAIAAVATSFETAAAFANYQQFLNKKPEESDAALLSSYNIMVQLMAMFATQADLRKRIVTLAKTTSENVDDIVGLGRTPQKKVA